jgi:ParB family chromosome partitioning protein
MIIDNLNLTQEELAKKIGKSRPHITNTLRILTLGDDILDLVDTKLVSMGHLKILVNIEEKKTIQKIINDIINNGLSVREVETLAKEAKKPSPKGKSRKLEIPRNKRLQSVLREKLDTKVTINGDKKGTIEISFSSEDDLGRILEKLSLI